MGEVIDFMGYKNRDSSKIWHRFNLKAEEMLVRMLFKELKDLDQDSLDIKDPDLNLIFGIVTKVVALYEVMMQINADAVFKIVTDDYEAYFDDAEIMRDNIKHLNMNNIPYEIFYCND